MEYIKLATQLFCLIIGIDEVIVHTFMYKDVCTVVYYVHTSFS